MRTLRIVTSEENLHGCLLSERVEDFQTNPQTRRVPMVQVSPVLRRLIEETTVGNSPPPIPGQSGCPGFGR